MRSPEGHVVTVDAGHLELQTNLWSRGYVVVDDETPADDVPADVPVDDVPVDDVPADVPAHDVLAYLPADTEISTI